MAQIRAVSAGRKEKAKPNHKEQRTAQKRLRKVVVQGRDTKMMVTFVFI